ncbi:MAG: hypothetical protein AAF489_12165 [Bacteroidota bacterium]
MKNFVITISLLCLSIGAFGQEKEQLNLLKADSTWIKEIIEFPIGFAQEIKFEGFEDLRFPEGWSKQDSPMFWSYVWAWSITATKELTENDIERNIQFYFDGLLGIGSGKNAKGEIHQTSALFVKREAGGDTSEYIGKVKTFDTRYSNKPLTFHVLAEQYYCERQKKAVLIFRYSPKTFEDDAWLKLKSITLERHACEN